jgi:hypothetical protein
MKTLAKTLLAAGLGLFGSLSMGTAQAAPYASGYGILPGGCYGDSNCVGGRCPTGNCPDGRCTTNTWPGRYNDYRYGTTGRFDGDYDFGRDHRDWDRNNIGLGTRPFASRFDSRYDRLDSRRDDDFGHDRFDRDHRFETRPGYLNVSNPGRPTYRW